MDTFKVKVQNGKIIGKAPVSLEEGTELELCLAEPDDEMDIEELARLRRALDAGWNSMKQGRFRPAMEVLAERRTRR